MKCVCVCSLLLRARGAPPHTHKSNVKENVWRKISRIVIFVFGMRVCVCLCGKMVRNEQIKHDILIFQYG